MSTASPAARAVANTVHTVAQNAPITVKSETGFWTAAGVWTGVVIALITLAAGVVRVWPRLVELFMGQRRADIEDLRKRISELETKVDAAHTAAHTAEMKLVYAVAAIQLLAAKVRADNPNDPTLAQAMELLAAATSGGFPGIDQRLAAGLSKMRGTNE
ncbi:MAG TPA: hypothetical protein VF592_03705 [Sphingomonas sp.]|jgi:hypothetical protein|uniref:hypothetical protein n=1 Tax=Sphingomonas sp. TaxID=28214 RepID=UPI002ED8C8B4